MKKERKIRVQHMETDLMRQGGFSMTNSVGPSSDSISIFLKGLSSLFSFSKQMFSATERENRISTHKNIGTDTYHQLKYPFTPPSSLNTSVSFPILVLFQVIYKNREYLSPLLS